jgi:hypothetical protein
MSFLRLALVASLTASTLASGPAGNENYQFKARSSLRSLSTTNKLSSRGNLEPVGISVEQTSYTFGIQDGTDAKVFISPAGDKFKKYSLSANGLSSLKQEAAGNVMPVTVFDVTGQSQLTCDSMGDAVSKYLSIDDVWNEVSSIGALHGLLTDPDIPRPGLHAEYVTSARRDFVNPDHGIFL